MRYRFRVVTSCVRPLTYALPCRCEGEVSPRVRERVYVGVGRDIYSSDGHRCRTREGEGEAKRAQSTSHGRRFVLTRHLKRTR